jgi:hypothetical protein
LIGAHDPFPLSIRKEKEKEKIGEITSSQGFMDGRVCFLTAN